MATHWIFSSTSLPHRGEPIDFQLDDHEEPIHGTFADGSFHSRWADYAIDRVPSWRKAVVDPMHEQIAAPGVAGRGSWLLRVQRLVAALRVNRVGVASPPACSGHPIPAAHRIRGVTAIVGITRQRHDSNQILS